MSLKKFFHSKSIKLIRKNLQRISFQLIRKPSSPWTIFYFVAIFLFFLAGSCRNRISKDNFILITLDTQRADFISSYSSQNVLTPNIDSLATEGILYENCFSLIPITLPSHASLFFSQPPYKLKNYNNGQAVRRSRKKPSFVNIFRKNDFQTSAFVSLGVLKAQFGLDEGFYVYEDEFPEGRWYLSAEEVNQSVFPWLEENKHQKFFMWIHYSDPHDPYSPPDLPPDLKLFLNDKLIDEYCLNKYIEYSVNLKLKKGENRLVYEIENPYINDPACFPAQLDKLNFFLEPDEKNIEINFAKDWDTQIEPGTLYFGNRSIINIINHAAPRTIKMSFRGRPNFPPEANRELYKREVEYMDGAIGKLWNKLKELGLFKKTHILIVGDHGEGLGEYSTPQGIPHIGHIHFLYNIYMKVPLIIYNPRASKKGIRRHEAVTLLDVAPTIMDIMGFERMDHFQGQSLLHPRSDVKLAILEETYAPEAIRNKFALLQSPWHLIITPKEKKYELYHLEKDPEEKKNIFREKSQLEEIIQLKVKLDTFAQEILKGKTEIKLDKKTKEMLKALGYIK